MNASNIPSIFFLFRYFFVYVHKSKSNTTNRCCNLSKSYSCVYLRAYSCLFFINKQIEKKRSSSTTSYSSKMYFYRCCIKLFSFILDVYVWEVKILIGIYLNSEFIKKRRLSFVRFCFVHQFSFIPNLNELLVSDHHVYCRHNSCVGLIKNPKKVN